MEIGWTFVLMLGNFFVLLFLLQRFFWKPAQEFLERRQAHIAQALSDAHREREEAAEALERYNEQLAGIKKEAQALIEKATRQGEENREEIIGKAKQEASRLLERARQEMAREKDKTLSELRKEVASLTVLATGRILEREMDEATQARLVQEFIEEMRLQ